jgi:hypothetical protein
VVVVASQGLLPQEGYQVAKLECANASSKLQHGLPCSNLVSAMIHLILTSMHSLFQDWNISLYKPLEYAFE